MSENGSSEIGTRNNDFSSRLLDRLSRTTSAGKVIREIDGLRFFAILGVVICHVNNDLMKGHATLYGAQAVNAVWDRILQNGSFGVHLFFAISGFVLALPFANRHLLSASPVPLSKYFLRRVTRLEPPYLINLMLFALMQVCLLHEALRPTLEHMLVSMIYLHNAIFQASSTVNPVAWSLEIEVQFYILAPIMGTVYMISNKRIRRSVLIASALAFALLQMFVLHHIFPPGMNGLTLLHKMQYFLVGFLLVDVYLVDWKGYRGGRFAADLVALLCTGLIVAALYYGFYPEIMSPILIYFLYVAAFQGNIWNKIVSNRWLVVSGGMCYTIYLYHGKVAALFVRAMSKIHLTGSLPVDTAIGLLLVCPALFVICSALFLLFEKPFMQKDWPQRWYALLTGLRKRSAQATETSSG